MSKEKRLALVTGGAGYLGFQLVEKLIASGWGVRTLDKAWSPSLLRAEQIVGDICEPADCVEASSGVDVIFHCVAAVPLVRSSHEMERVNVSGTENILNAAVQQKVSKVVHISSSAVYGVPKSLPVTHCTERLPFESYGKTKLQAEKICESYRSTGLDITIIRPRTIVGRGRLGLFSLLFELIGKNLKIPMIGKGDNFYQLIHIDDLTRAIIASSDGPPNHDFNLGTSHFSSLKHDLETFISKVNSRSRIISCNKTLITNSLLVFSRLRLLPFAEYQIRMYSENFFFDSDYDWSILEITPEYSNLDALCSSYLEFSESENRELFNDGVHLSPHNRHLSGSSVTFVKRIMKFLSDK